MGHLGLTPQSVEGLGGHKVQGELNLLPKKITKMPWRCSKRAVLP